MFHKRPLRFFRDYLRQTSCVLCGFTLSPLEKMGRGSTYKDSFSEVGNSSGVRRVRKLTMTKSL